MGKSGIVGQSSTKRSGKELLRDVWQQFKKSWEQFKEVAVPFRQIRVWCRWKYGDAIRLWFRYAILAAIFLKVLIFFGEVLLERPEKLPTLAALASALHLQALIAVLDSPTAKIVFILIALALLWDYSKEFGKPGYEYAFVKTMWTFVNKHHEACQKNDKIPLSDALKEFYEFLHKEKKGIQRVAVFLEKDGELTVAKDHMYPPPRPEESNPFPTLYLNKSPQELGVGGRVYLERISRYLPWCSPSKRDVSDIVTFDFSKQELQIEPKSLFVVWQGNIPFKALLCVPLMSADGKCIGVIDCSFSKRYTLDSSDILMAVEFGLVLGPALPYLAT
jgi:hypothetical protein